MSCKFLIASTYDYIRNTCLWLTSTWMLNYYYLPAIALCMTISWTILSMQRPFIHPYAYSILNLLFTSITTAVFILLLLLFHYCYCHKTVATDKLCRASLFPGAAELTIHLSGLINILCLPLCQINKFGFYFPQRLLWSPTVMGYHGSSRSSW